MSLTQIRRVQARCPEQGGELLVLLSLASRANDDGSGIWADDMGRLAYEARMSVENYRVVLGKLASKGRLSYHDRGGRNGGPSLSLHLPLQALTRDRWEEMLEARRAEKRARCKPMGRPKAGKTIDADGPAAPAAPKRAPGSRRNNLLPALPPTPVTPEINLYPFRAFTPPSQGNKLLFQGNNLLAENALAHRPGAGFWAPYGPVQSLKDVVIDLASNPREADLVGEVACAPLLDPAGLDDWTEEDEKLFTSAPLGQDAMPGDPDGSAPDGAPEAVTPSLDSLEGVQEAETLTAGEKVPRRRAGPGEEPYELLKALCGGSVQAPNLLKLVTEPTTGGGTRQDWLTLTVGEIQDARVAAKATFARGEAVFRTALIQELDRLVDGAGRPAPRAAGPRLSAWQAAEQAPRPGDGDSEVVKNPWRVGQRVRLSGALGVVIGATADARQAIVTVDLDDGQREALTMHDAAMRLRDALDAPPPPPPTPVTPTGTPTGSQWRLQNGKIVTVTEFSLSGPLTSDGTRWAPYGKHSLAAMAERVVCNDAAGAA